MVDDLQTAGNVIENRGYTVSGYKVRGFQDRTFQSVDEDPGKALDQFLDQLYDSDTLDAPLSTENLLNLFEEGSEQHVENAVNEMLYQIRGRIFLEEPEPDHPDHPINYAYIHYHPHTQDGFFELLSGAPSAHPYLEEFDEALTQEGFRTETPHWKE